MRGRSSMARDEERRFIIDCIAVYRSLPALWNIRCKEYNDRSRKAEAYEILLRKYRERYPEAGRIDVTKKFNSLRTNFRKELRRISELKRNCVNSGDCSGVSSSLWYFDEMLFLQAQENFDKGNCKSFFIGGDEDQAEFSVTIYPPSGMGGTSKLGRPIKRVPKTSHSQGPSPCSDYRRLESGQDREEKEEREYERICRAWSSELRKMEPVQQIFAKKAISEILYEGQLGTLRRNSVVINGNIDGTLDSWPKVEPSSGRSPVNVD